MFPRFVLVSVLLSFLWPNNVPCRDEMTSVTNYTESGHTSVPHKTALTSDTGPQAQGSPVLPHADQLCTLSGVPTTPAGPTVPWNSSQNSGNTLYLLYLTPIL